LYYTVLYCVGQFGEALVTVEAIMSFSIVLSEDDFRSMETHLREDLLKWYFERPRPVHAMPRAVHNSGTPGRSETAGEIGEVTPPESAHREEDGFRRVTFPELLQSGLMSAGDEIWCRALRRDRRQGAPDFIKGGKVTENGTVEFQGRRFSRPSKLALAMVNSNQSSRPAPAVNGYDYLFVRSGDSLVSLKKKREELVSDADQALSSGSGSDVELLAKAQTLAKANSTPEKPVTARQILRAGRRLAAALSTGDNRCTLQEALELIEQESRKRMEGAQ
jgi:hypothetical protein